MIHEIAFRYARALFEAVKAANGKADQTLNEVRAIAEAFRSNSSLREFMESPAVSATDKQAALNSLSGKVSEDVVRFLVLLASKGRLEFVDQIAQAMESMIDAEHGMTRGTVRSAAVLDPDQRKNLEETVRKVTGKQVILSFDVDPSLVGGLVAKVGGWTFDDSLTTHLTTLKEDLSRQS